MSPNKTRLLWIPFEFSFLTEMDYFLKALIFPFNIFLLYTGNENAFEKKKLNNLWQKENENKIFN